MVAMKLMLTEPPRLRPMLLATAARALHLLTPFMTFLMVKIWPQLSSTVPCLADYFTLAALPLSWLDHLHVGKRRFHYSMTSPS
jgi:hypothetical protein